MYDVKAIAQCAREAFFNEVFKHLPPGTSGDFSPDATLVFDEASELAVRDLLQNVPPQRYFVLYEVEWRPASKGEDAPLDVDHDLNVDDHRVTRIATAAIGDAGEVREALETAAEVEHPWLNARIAHGS